MKLLAAVLLLAALCDLRKGKIPNLLILIGFILGFGQLLSEKDIDQIFNFFPGIILPPILLFPLFCTGTLGAGDIKLFSLIGCFLPARDTLNCILLSFFCGALFSIPLLLLQRRLISRMRYALSFLLGCLMQRSVGSYYPPGEEGERMKKETSIPFAVPILISTLLVLGGIGL